MDSHARHGGSRLRVVEHAPRLDENSDSGDGALESRMESNARYYWRRVCDELTAASNAVTPAARMRHEELVWLFVARLKNLKAPCPYTDPELAQMLGTNALEGQSALH